MVHRWVTRLGTSARGLGLPIHPILQASAHPKAPLCYKSPMKIIEHWLLFKYIEGQFTPLWKPFRSKDQAEKARLKLPERERRGVAVGVIRVGWSEIRSRPSNLHLGAEHQLDSSAHLVVGQEFTAIELVQTFFDLLPEPYVMVNIVFDELLDVFLRAAVVGFRCPVNPRL